jgi:hypothetical protein
MKPLLTTSPCTILLACTLSINTYQSWAQAYIDLVRLSYGATALTPFEGSSARTRIVDFVVDSNIPVVINQRVTLLTGFAYEQVQTKLFQDISEQTLRSAGAKLGINIKHTGEWTGTYMLLTRMTSASHEITSRHLQVGGLFVLKHQVTEHTSYKFGLFINDELFGTWIVPMVGLYYHNPQRRLELSILLPLSFDINYKLSSRVRAGFMYTGLRRSYQWSSLPAAGGSGYVDRAVNELGVYLSVQAARKLVVQARIGHTLGRHYRVFNDHDKMKLGLPLAPVGDDRTQLNTDFADGWQAQMQLIYRLPLTHP